MGVKSPSVETVFGEAIEIASEVERSAYLDRACGGDLVLRREVESLLDAHVRAGGFLQSSTEPETLTLGPPPADGLGMTIGPYKLLEAIGEGGMGVVYMAEQTQPVRRKVALKLIKPGMDSKPIIARFEVERQALAMMDHPNIARVHDAGATAEGRPYFVMELVHGIPITNYCDRERLTIPERLELFVLVCRAVQHAHQKGVIHRDLKPSNILVTVVDGAAVPKVIDFGIAKATGQSLTDKTCFTAFAQFIGTPMYMSPEQAELSGVDADTRSDVYALGVLLYELLTGTTPFDGETFRKAAFDEIRRIVREDEPPKPSTRLSALGATDTAISANRRTDGRRLDRSIRGELDWITMKALDKDRRRRYETANDFAADVMNYLTYRPVEACPPSGWYRFSKYARRHRAALTTTALVGLALVAGTAASTWQAVRATLAEGRIRVERDRALNAEAKTRVEADKVKAINQFLTLDLLKQAEPANNAVEDHVTLLEILDRAADNVGGRFHAQPEIEVALRSAIADSYHGLASWEKAERQWQACRELARRQAAEPAEPFWVDSQLAHIRMHRGEPHEEVLRMARSAAEGLGKTLGPDHVDTIAARGKLAVAYNVAGRTAEAVPLLESTLDQRESKLGADHPHTLTTRNDLAVAYVDAGRVAEAVPLYESILRQWESKLGPDHPSTLTTRHNLGIAYRDAGRVAEAIALLESTLERRESKLGADHPHTLATRNELARTYADAGRAAEAVPLYESILRQWEPKLGPDHPDTLAARSNLGAAYVDSGRPGEAVPLLESTLRHQESKLGPDHPHTVTIRSNLGAAYLKAGRAAEAAPLLESTLKQRESKLGPDHPDTVTIRSNLGTAYLDAGRTSEAVPLLESTLKQLESKLGRDHRDTLTTRHNLGLAYRDAGRVAEAIALLGSTLERRESKLGAAHLHTLVTRAELARTYLDAGRAAEAVPLYESMLKHWESKLGPNHPNALAARTNLGAAYVDVGRDADAIALLEPTLKQWETKFGADHPNALTTRNNLACAYRDAGRTAEAVELLESTLAQRESKLGADHPNTLATRSNLARAYLAAGRTAEAVETGEATLKLLESKLGPDHRRTRDTRNDLAQGYLDARRWAEAEAVARAGLGSDATSPADDWRIFLTRSQLGAALAGREKPDEAESWLVSGYEGMKSREATIPAPRKGGLAEAGRRVVRLYETWGKTEQAEQWRKRVETTSPDLPADVFAGSDKVSVF